MSNVPLPPIYENHAGRWIDVDDCTNYAAAVSAEKDAEIERLRAEVAGLREWLEADARCPCCDTTDACVEGCTFATDCPQDAERMAEVLAAWRALAARKGEA